MAITWQERENEEQDMVNDPSTIEALKDCGLLKYFKLSGIRQQIEILQFLVRAWDPIDKTFHIRDKMVPITIEDIYFLTELSRRGAPLSPSRFSRGGQSVRDYIRRFFQLGT